MEKRINISGKGSLKMTVKLLAAAFFILHASLFVSCSDWDDHYENTGSQAGNGLTLWQTMQQYEELRDFREVLSKTMVFRHHKKTSISYADLLDGVQTFTVLAPVNGSFNKDSILELVTTNRGDSMVVRSFVGNHLSYNLTTSIDKPTEFFLLNSKRATIGNGMALNAPVIEANIKARGGILHILKSTLPYRPNLYEIMLNDPRYSLIGEQLSSYEQDEFNPSQSVEGGMVDGEQIYVDSVFIERNRLLEEIGELAAEDSTYLFVVPTADEWQRVWNEAMSHFRYDATVENGDSLQRFWANYALLNDAVFSRTIQSSPQDSLITYLYDKRYPDYHVFHRPYDEGGILYGAKATELSNGTLYTVSQWPFTPLTTYHREIKVEGERTGLVVGSTKCTYNTRIHAADSVSENEYLVITPESSNNWTITFKLENTLAGKYDVGVVILPATVYDPAAELKKCQFTVDFNYVDEKGEPQVKDFDKKKFNNNPAKGVDTVWVAQNLEFPVCNYDQTNMKFTLTLKCSVLAREANKYAREMFLDCIYLRPKRNSDN